jgi:hypothetical protein
MASRRSRHPPTDAQFRLNEETSITTRSWIRRLFSPSPRTCLLPRTCYRPGFTSPSPGGGGEDRLKTVTAA